ncbi:hypothetical protein WG947_07805 [Pontibacter sp. H259]|uniref:hypothetical protein n=1 Tax=Pontibacter sp. H259 TaxID=3133421 RepID=UPI0030BB2917
MNRQERDRYDYGRYDGYNNDEHYHGARNLTNEFEQHYRQGRGSDYESERYRPERSYHEGSDIEDTYYRQNRTGRNLSDRTRYDREDRDTDTNYYGHYNDNQDNYRGDEAIFREDRANYQQYGGRGMSSSFADDYGAYDSGRNFGSRDQEFAYGSRNTSGNVRFIPDSDEGSSFRSGANYAGDYGYDNDTRYNGGRGNFSSRHWNNDGERNRYY